jgi:CrcB protein
MSAALSNVALWAGVLVIGGVGSVARFMVDRAVARRSSGAFPVGTLTVNISGALLLGLVTGLTLSHGAALLAGTALLGAYTTFSTWMLETQRLAEERRIWPAVLNIVLSLVLGLAAAATGQWIASRL